jgi:ABC-type lipoprotein export system ATPase subunit
MLRCWAQHLRDSLRRPKDVYFVNQDYRAHLLPYKQIEWNAALPLLIDGMNEGDALRQAADVLDTLNPLVRQSGRYIFGLSGGESHTVALAAALLAPASYLFLDEPTGQLDSGKKEVFWQSLWKRVSTQRIAIISQHDSLPDPFVESTFQEFEYLNRQSIKLSALSINLEESGHAQVAS